MDDGFADDERLERALGRAWRDDLPWELLTELTQLPHRMGGSEHEARAAEIVAETFAEAGLEDVEQREFPMHHWQRGHTEFEVVREDGPDRTFAAIALPYSPAGDVEGPLVDVGYGTPEEIAEADLEGGIAVASTTTPAEKRFVHRMEKFGHAVDAGAEAFVFVNHVDGQLPPTGALEFAGEAIAPGIGVSAETGDWLREYAERGAHGRITVDATTDEGSSRNVTGVVGPDTDEEILVVAHYDSHDVAEGALDNGCGIATVAGAASTLSEVADELDRRVRIAGVGCEEIGLLGAEALAEGLDLESVRAVVNVDGAGRFRNLVAMTHGSDDLGNLAERVTDAAGQPVVRDDDPHPFSDHWPFLRAGVPALQLHSDPPEGGERGRGWGHTAADTRDKVDPRNLREHAMLTALLVLELTDEDESVSRIDVADLREKLRAQDYEPGMRAAGIWPDGWNS
ncbi:M28 family peptidase [Natronobacterium texcoconense]|uniref:Carboxypeptidase Q n=1 Tax=Natronobacterium texcoconense TaxID=1095778 RepID=A0A1H1IAD1_NATTX|nr:M28 family metallopeptidase [Natronobacterium texcoconense]SDR34651.1 Zn-dependent amino-or carboxypeptidase, M28 family [Natronobacterium texcoconense]